MGHRPCPCRRGFEALLVRHRSDEVDASYAAYDKHPADEPDELGRPSRFDEERFTNGTLSGSGNYEHGEKHGHWAYWFRNGRLKATGGYAHGQLTGAWVWIARTATPCRAGPSSMASKMACGSVTTPRDSCSMRAPTSPDRWVAGQRGHLLIESLASKWSSCTRRVKLTHQCYIYWDPGIGPVTSGTNR